MVNKKTTDKDVKKVSTAVAENTAKKNSKTTNKETMTKAKKPAAKKVSESVAKDAAVVKTTRKVTSASKKATVKTGSVPMKENTDVVASVLETKAQNEAKKVAKTIKVKTAVVNSGASVGKNNGVEAAAVRSKRGALKENVQKAEAKKFMDLKENTLSEQEVCTGKCCFLSGIKTFFAAWLDGYRKIFQYNGRTNRYDFWAFMLVNFVLFLFITIPYQLANFVALANEQYLPTAVEFVYWGLFFVIMLACISLYVRRLHDAGYNSWEGFFRPMTYSILGIIALIIVGQISVPADDIATTSDWRSSALGWGLIVLLLINLYYLCKTFIAAAFMEEDAVNAYGEPKLLKDCSKKKVVRYATLYLILSIFYTVFLIIHFYYSLMLLTGGSMY